MNARKRLEKLSALNGKKGEEYGRFEKIGEVLATQFPQGVTLKTSDEFNRFVMFTMIALKLDRLSNYIPGKVHEDSLDDAAVYAMMLRSFDADGNT
jgi:hypothetical protein